VGEFSSSTAEVPRGRSKHQRTEGAKRKLGTLHASCATGNLNNRPSDPVTICSQQFDAFSPWGQTLIACGGCARCRRFLEGLNGGLLVVEDLENGIQPGHLQQVLDLFGKVDEL
jgi:hypothetical protein